VGLTVLCVVVGMWSATEVRAAGDRKVTVTPRVGLVDFTGDGQYVTVRWEGFTPRGFLYARECQRGADTISSRCSQGGYFSVCGLSCPGAAYLGQSDPRGRGSSTMPIAVGAINIQQNLEPIDGKTFVCDWQNDCSLFVMEDPFDLATATEIPLRFAEPKDACPEDSSVLSGSGGAAAARLFLGMALQVCKDPLKLGLEYVLKVDHDAIEDYRFGSSDFAVTTTPMDGAQRAGLEAAGRTAAYAPVSASGLVVGFSIMDQLTQQRVNELTLTPELLAKIFSGKLTSWSDPAIRKLNPTIGFPPTIVATARGDANEDSLTFTRFLWATARKTWIAGGVGSGIKPNPFAVGPTDLLPSLGQIYLTSGAKKLASFVARGEGEFEASSTYGRIGYMDASLAAQYSLPTVTLLLDNGKRVEASPATLRAGLASMLPSPSGLLRPDYRIKRSNVWPIPTVSYAVIPHGAAASDEPPDAATAKALESLIRFAVGPGQEDLPPGYVPLSAQLGARARTLAGQILKAPPEDDDLGDDPSPDPDPGNDPGTTGSASGGGSTGGYSSGYGPTGSVTGPTGTSGGGGSSPAPGVVTIAVPPTPPPYALASSTASRVLPLMILVGLAAMIAGVVLLFGDRIGARLATVRPVRRGRHRAGAPKGSP
jgi:phosphate transport system substrate-binding protein